MTYQTSCKENKDQQADCSKFINEIYQTIPVDSQTIKEVYDYQDYLLKKFNDTSIKQLNYEAYHLQFYSTHGFGKAVKFERKKFEGIDGLYYYLSVKCLKDEDWNPDCENYVIGLEKEEWDIFEQLIYEFDFWVEESKFLNNENVLDGYGYLLEGIRPEAKKCNKKTYQFIVRGSPEFDKMGALSEYILAYEEQLAARYGKRK